MATKTFKIGLSNADKQAMAQETYERVLALTFPEYDSAEEYSVGDFVVYNDQLYKCIGATTGEWDSTKWQLATFNDLVEDIEGAVAFVNNKANVDGNYPTMTVGEADNLTPYDEEAGAEQNKPFFFQATGTANGSDPDFVTGSVALMREKRGNTVVVNQKLNPEDNGTETENDVTFTFLNGKCTANGTASATTNVNMNKTVCDFIEGHKYLILGISNGSVSTYGIRLNTWGVLFYEVSIWTCTSSSGSNVQFHVESGVQLDNVAIEPHVVDLTQWFNGSIPQDLLDHPDHFFRYYQGSLEYNEGTLVNANSRYIKCIGRQQWDEEWEQGYLDSSGQPASSNDYIRSKNYIKVIPSKSYYIKSPYASYVFYYDKDKNFISSEYMQNYNFTIPSNCCFLKFHANSSTYNNDITISIYYDNESGYDGIYLFEELTNNDTGTEVLRSAGNVADIKLPSGEIKRNVGVETITSDNLQFADDNGSRASFTLQVSNNILYTDQTKKPNILFSDLITVSQSDTWSAGTISCVAGNQVATIYMQFPTGTTKSDVLSKYEDAPVYYELATPTTEQGTLFSENLVIHDFGTMDFSGASGVPQGNAIFYPVDYKAYLDTLHKYTEGDPDNLALKTDLPTAPNTYLTSLTGYDATKTQVLKNVEGTLTWVTEGE